MLGPDAKVGSHYRADKIAVWNKLIPDLISASNISKTTKPVSPAHPPSKYVPDNSANNQLRGDAPGLVNLGKKRDDSRNVFLINDNIPVSIVVILGLILLMFNLLACAGVYYQKQKVKRREINLERRIKRMSDAGFVMDDSASHQSGLIVDSNVERETRDEAHYGTLNSTQSGVSAKRPHFQLRSNSVRDAATAGGEGSSVVLKSALKKTNTSAEMLTDNCGDSKCLLYNDKTFVEAAYPRQAKSIPNINHYNDNNVNENPRNDASLSRIGKEKPLSKSSNFLSKEKKRGADELVMYDSLPSPTEPVESRRKDSGTTNKLTSLASNLLRGSGLKKDGRPPSPIIEMRMVQPASTPTTYNFPSRQTVNGEPIYSSRPLLAHRAPLASPYGIAYPVYSHTGSLPRPLYPGLPPQPQDQYINMMARPGLTTPRHGLHLPLGPLGSLPNTKTRQLAGLAGPRNTWTDQQCLYGVRPPLARLNSLDSATSQQSSAPDLLPVKMTNATSQTPQQAKYGAPVTTGQSQSAQQAKYGVLSASPSTSPQSPLSQQAKLPAVTSAKVLPTTSVQSQSSQPVVSLAPSSSSSSSSSVTTTVSTANTTAVRQAAEGSEKEDNDVSNDDNKETSPVVNTSTPNTPVLRKVGEKTPPNTLKRDRPQSSCKSWYSQYSQGFLSKTIDTPDIELPPLGDEDDDEEETDSDKSPNNERKVRD